MKSEIQSPQRRRRVIWEPGASAERSEARRPWWCESKEARALKVRNTIVSCSALSELHGPLMIWSRGDAPRTARRLPLAVLFRAFGAALLKTSCEQPNGKRTAKSSSEFNCNPKIRSIDHLTTNSEFNVHSAEGAKYEASAERAKRVAPGKKDSGPWSSERAE